MTGLPEKRLRQDLAHLTAVVVSIVITASLSPMAFAQTQAPKAPPTRQDNFREVIHGVEIVRPVPLARGSGEPRDAPVDRCPEQIHSWVAGRPSVAPAHSKAVDGVDAHRHGHRAV